MTRTLLSAGLAACLAIAAAVAPAVAQNFNLTPSFGSYELNAGFAPDPYRVSVTAGGSVPAERLGGATCVGTIANSPDVTLYYTAGGFDLTFFVNSGADTTLVVNDANGRWYCDDDGFGNLDPQVTIRNPPSGKYDIWIGSYGRGSRIPATLNFSELY